MIFTLYTEPALPDDDNDNETGASSVPYWFSRQNKRNSNKTLRAVGCCFNLEVVVELQSSFEGDNFQNNDIKATK